VKSQTIFDGINYLVKLSPLDVYDSKKTCRMEAGKNTKNTKNMANY